MKKEALLPQYLIFQVTNSARSEQNFDHLKLIPLRSFHQCRVSSLYDMRFLSTEVHILCYVLIYLGAGVDISTQFDQTSHEVDIARIGSNHEQRILILCKGGKQLARGMIVSNLPLMCKPSNNCWCRFGTLWQDLQSSWLVPRCSRTQTIRRRYPASWWWNCESTNHSLTDLVSNLPAFPLTGSGFLNCDQKIEKADRCQLAWLKLRIIPI